MTFSSRVQWDLRPNRLTKLLQEKRDAGVAITDLTESNPTRVGLEYPVDSIFDAFRKIESLRYAPEPRGLLTAREAISRTYRQPPDPDRVLLTASTSEAYSLLFKLLCNPGDEVLVPQPSYPLFEYLATLESVRVVQYPLHYYEEWTIDTYALERRITERTKAIITVNPNNPTGNFLKTGELDGLVGLAARHGLALISDEVFAPYGLGADDRRVESIADVCEVLTFSLSGLSKYCALPQMKLGWMVANGPTAIREEAMSRLELIADTFLSVGTAVQLAAAELLAIAPTMQGRILNRIEGNIAHLKKSRVDMLRTEGGWYVVVRVPRTRSDEEWTLHLLEKHKVLVQPGYFYDFGSEGFVVISLIGDRAPEAVLDELSN